MSEKKAFLPYGRQCIDDDDVAAVAKVLKSDWLTTGPAVSEFEAAFSKKTGDSLAVACSNGTAALHIAAMALGISEGDYVIVPTITFLATANAVRYVGAEVVFADVDQDSGLLTIESLEEAYARAPGPVKAIFPVHLNGQSVNMPAIHAWASARNIKIVEDACHALGTTYVENGMPVGSCSYSDMACFSFHPVKTIAMGEGGMVTTKDPEIAERLFRFRSHGMTRDNKHFENTDAAYDAEGNLNPWYYEMPEPGYNYRACDIQCALGLSQLSKLDQFAERRRQLIALYDKALLPLAPVIMPVKKETGCDPVFHLCSVQIDFAAIGISRAQFMNKLREKGIGTQVHYIPVHHQPYYQKRYGLFSLKGAETYYNRQISLPLYVGMDDSDVERVASALSSIIEAHA